MKVAAIVSVKNEVELIARCVDHLFSIGVDEVLVEDYGSDDGTLELLGRYAADRLRIVPFDEAQDLDGTAWGKHAAGLAQATGADWVLFLDADEFWLPVSGRIKDALAQERHDVLSVDRFNVPLGPDGPYLPSALVPAGYAQALLYTQRTPNFRSVVSSDPTRPWSSGVPAPKVAVRPQSIVALRGGHHKAIAPDGSVFPATRPGGLLIAHLPFTTRTRFSRKVSSIRQTFALQPAYHAGERVAWHWKRWLQLEEEGQLEQEFERQIVPQETIDALRAAGSVASAADYFSRG